MNTCSAEVVSHIIEYACSSDSGQTARKIGLVSKYLRSIAEPIELRTISVSGLKQLQGANSRLKLVNTSPRITPSARPIYVRHLFICELTEEDAITADACRQPVDRWRCTSKCAQAAATYKETEREFWELATLLVQSTCTSLRTLFLSTSENWHMPLDPNLSHNHAKVLGAISGTTFPKLVSLTLMHDASEEIRTFAYSGSSFRAPTIPRLRKLRITSSILMDTIDQAPVSQRSHPLLAILRNESSELTHLDVCNDEVWTSHKAVRLVFGEDWRTSLSGGTLPGRLKLVILRQGYLPSIPRGIGYRTFEGKVQKFITDIAKLNVSGLKSHAPTPMNSDFGKRGYWFGLLVADWKEQCLVNK